jgi:hypothetical protein
MPNKFMLINTLFFIDKLKKGQNTICLLAIKVGNIYPADCIQVDTKYPPVVEDSGIDDED